MGIFDEDLPDLVGARIARDAGKCPKAMRGHMRPFCGGHNA